MALLSTSLITLLLLLLPLCFLLILKFLILIYKAHMNVIHFFLLVTAVTFSVQDEHVSLLTLISYHRLLIKPTKSKLENDNLSDVCYNFSWLYDRIVVNSNDQLE